MLNYNRDDVIRCAKNPECFLNIIDKNIRDLVYRNTLFDGILTRDELIDQAKARGKYWEYTNKEYIKIEPPLNSNPNSKFNKLVGTHEQSPNFVCELEDVQLIGPYGLCRTDSEELVLENMGAKSDAMFRLRETVSDLGLSTLKKKLNKNTNPDYSIACSLITRHRGAYRFNSQNPKGNYAHWLTEDLPKLRAVEHYIKETGNKPVLILNSNPPSWMTETLELMGFSERDWVRRGRDIISVENLVLPKLNKHHSFGADICKSDKNYVRQKLTRNITKKNNTKRNDRIYISRQNSARRRLANYNELINKLSKHGFKSYNFEDMSMEEEIDILSSAELIVGPHGAGLASMLYTEESTVIELHPEKIVGTGFYLLANELGHDYGYVIGSSNINNRKKYKNIDFRIQPKSILEFVDKPIV